MIFGENAGMVAARPQISRRMDRINQIYFFSHLGINSIARAWARVTCCDGVISSIELIANYIARVNFLFIEILRELDTR